MQQLMGAFGPDIDAEYAKIKGAGDEALRRSFGAAQADIGSQFTGAMRGAQGFLGGHPLLADSGYANRLNRQIQTSAYGDLSRAYGGAAAQQAQAQQSALERLIQTKLGGRQDLLMQLMGGAKKKAGFGDYAGQLLGTGLGAWAGGGFK